MRNLGEGTDIQTLAWQIVSKCELIAPNRLPELEQILAYLQSRRDSKGGIEGEYAYALHITYGVVCFFLN